LCTAAFPRSGRPGGPMKMQCSVRPSGGTQPAAALARRRHQSPRRRNSRSTRHHDPARFDCNSPQGDPRAALLLRLQRTSRTLLLVLLQHSRHRWVRMTRCRGSTRSVLQRLSSRSLSTPTRDGLPRRRRGGAFLFPICRPTQHESDLLPGTTAMRSPWSHGQLRDVPQGRRTCETRHLRWGTRPRR